MNGSERCEGCRAQEAGQRRVSLKRGLRCTMPGRRRPPRSDCSMGFHRRRSRKFPILNQAKREKAEAAAKKTAEAEQTLAKADEQMNAELTTAYKPRPKDDYPAVSSGRRLAFAKWIANSRTIR